MVRAAQFVNSGRLRLFSVSISLRRGGRMPDFLKVKNWRKWQTYRSDRGQPPWIKLHRRLMRNPHWVELTDSQRGQLIVIWLLAADHEGEIPDSASTLKKLCFMSGLPDLNLFIDKGFIEAR